MSTRVFGVSLQEVMGRTTERTIPTFIKKIIRYLNAEAIETEGLFRISAKANLLEELKQTIDAGNDVDFSEAKDPHLVAGLLKQYLRELPEPLFTFELYPQFVAAASEYEQAANLARAKSGFGGVVDQDHSHTDRYIDTLSELVDKLPPANKALAEILLLFLSRVGEKSSKNKMTPANLAIVFGQILLRAQVETIESMMNASKITGIMKFMIEKFEKVFPKQKAKRLAKRPSVSSDVQKGVSSAQSEKQTEEQEKLAKIKETVNDAIGLVQKKLTAMHHQLEETESLDLAIDIARRVRTAKKVLFPAGEEPKVAVRSVAPVASSSGSGSVSSSSGPSGGASPAAAAAAPPAKVWGPPPEMPDVFCNLVVESGSACSQGKRKTMEDYFVVLDNLRENFPQLHPGHRWSLYAIYDGHGGHEASKMCQELLHGSIVSQPAFLHYKFDIALKEGFEQTDVEILKEARKNEWKGGSTAVVVLLHNDTLILANAGDSEAIIGRVGADGYYEAMVVSERHRATEPKEKARIEKEGGAVFSGRVFGTLAVSRSLGDADFKKPAQEANFVTCEPYTTSVDLTENEHFLVLGCDGLWDKILYQEVVDLVGTCFNQGLTPSEACQEVVNEAINRGAVDNVTVIIVRLLREYDDDLPPEDL